MTVQGLIYVILSVLVRFNSIYLGIWLPDQFFLFCKKKKKKIILHYVKDDSYHSEYRGDTYQHSEGIYDKSTANIILSGEKLKVLPLNSETRQGCPLSPLLFNIVLEILATTIRKENKWKVSKFKGKRESPVFADGMTHCMENPKSFISKLLELINEFRKVAGYTIHI